MNQRKKRSEGLGNAVKLILGLIVIILVMFFLNVAFGGTGSSAVTVYPAEVHIRIPPTAPSCCINF